MKPQDRLRHAKVAVAMLKEARDTLRAADCNSAAAYAQRALKSAEGAVRHAQRLVGEAERFEATPDYLKPLLEG